MSGSELLPCFCRRNYKDADNGHLRTCPAYYRAVVAEHERTAVEAMRATTQDFLDEHQHGGCHQCGAKDGDYYITKKEAASWLAAIRRIEG